jgi:cyclopropane fatty-acyl-phospholipid synthase-like methyltransferase
MLTLIFTIIGFGFLLAVFFLFQGPQFVPSSDQSAKEILELVQAKPGSHILDLGSGDGKLVMALARQGYRVTGIELNPLLVLRSRQAIKRAGLSPLADIAWGNFWRHDLSRYDVVVLFVVKHVMPRLERKLRLQLRPGSQAISNYFLFPGLEPQKSTGATHAYLF